VNAIKRSCSEVGLISRGSASAVACLGAGFVLDRVALLVFVVLLDATFLFDLRWGRGRATPAAVHVWSESFLTTQPLSGPSAELTSRRVAVPNW